MMTLANGTVRPCGRCRDDLRLLAKHRSLNPQPHSTFFGKLRSRLPKRHHDLWNANLLQKKVSEHFLTVDDLKARPLIRCLLRSVAWIHPNVLFIKLYYRFISQKRVFKVRQVWLLSKKWTMVKIPKVQPFILQNLLEVIKKRKRDGDKARAKMYD